MKIKKIAIYHPQINNYGGGETVALTIADFLSKKYGSVDVFCVDIPDKKRLEKFFALDLKNINFIKLDKCILPFNTVKSSMILKKTYKMFESYDLVIDSATNGWFDRKLNVKTICYVHYPFFYSKKSGFKRLIQPFIIQPKNAFVYDKIICNSKFTKDAVLDLVGDKFSKKEILVINPPVEVNLNPTLKKKKIIVSVGRFSSEKKHEVMIDAFKKLFAKVKDYEFHIIGSFQEGISIYKEDYLEMLKEKAKGFPIKFHVNMNHDKVLRFLEESEIYWHARGYGETDFNEYENFGITTAEAMAAGCVPIVINLGAQPDIVDHGKNGYCWNNPNELVIFTIKIIKSAKLRERFLKQAIIKSKKYDLKIFINEINKVISKIF